ncbi:hypothetical protein CN546_14180 [Bacillus wiedmannii]|nr:hypothetical protein CN546_14180 [Bacillus wiedmannii]
MEVHNVANISGFLNRIRTAIYGKDVRESIHDGIDAINKETEIATKLSNNIKIKQVALEKKYDDQISNMTNENPSISELVDFRTSGFTGMSYVTAGKRADAIDERITDMSVSIKDFGADLTGETDSTVAIQQTIDYVYDRGGGVVHIPPGILRYTSIIVKIGVHIRGSLVSITDWNGRLGSNTSVTTLIPTDLNRPSIIMHGNSTINGICWFYEGQKKELASESDTFIQYPPTIQLGDASNKAIGNYIGNFIVIGAYDFISQYSFSNSVEKLFVEKGYGMFLNTFCTLKKCTDIPRFSKIHMNLNSALGWLTGNTVPYYSKIARNGVMFKVARVDDCVIEDCFAYGVKHFAHLYKEVGEDGNGGGITVIGSSCDVCHQAFRNDRGNLSFGVKVIGGFFTPVVNVDGSERCLIYLSQNATFTRIQFSSFKCYGDVVSQVSNTSKTDHIIVFENGNMGNNVVNLFGDVQFNIGISKNENVLINNVVNFIGTDRDSSLSKLDKVTTRHLVMTGSRIDLTHGVDDIAWFKVNNEYAFGAVKDAYDPTFFTKAYFRAGTLTSLPTANANHRGKMIRLEGANGVEDKLFICKKKSDGTYHWKQLDAEQ